MSDWTVATDAPSVSSQIAHRLFAEACVVSADQMPARLVFVCPGARIWPGPRFDPKLLIAVVHWVIVGVVPFDPPDIAVADAVDGSVDPDDTAVTRPVVAAHDTSCASVVHTGETARTFPFTSASVIVAVEPPLTTDTKMPFPPTPWYCAVKVSAAE